MEAEAKPHSFFRGWVKSALFSLILVPLALVLFLVHERLIAYYGPSPGPAWKSLLIALPEEAALACLVALFLGLAACRTGLL